LLKNILLFGRVLRGAGVAVDPARMLTLVRALEYVDIGRQRDVQAAARACLVNRPQDLSVFDEVWRVFWRPPKSPSTTMDLRSMGEERRYRKPEALLPGSEREGETDETPGQAADRVDFSRTYSAREVLRTKDFASYTAQEMAQARRMLAELRWDVGQRRTRRWSGGAGPMLDLRRTLRASARLGGELASLQWRERQEKPRPLVLLCDVSGSMEQYTRMLLHFVHLVAGVNRRMEAFVFGTRLTRITRQMVHRGVDKAVLEVSKTVPDWAGGTRIGEAVRTFNYRWSRRVLRSGGVVLVISDGWDRGEPEVLAQEMGRLQRSCHRLIWLNPLLGGADYQPLTRGMQAALPHVDDFLPVHNLASLEDLARRLSDLPAKRGERRRLHNPLTPPLSQGERANGVEGSTASGQVDANPTFRHPLWGRS
jgi:uncharacterized protein with von Willebrand factor type A (vWA) domain